MSQTVRQFTLSPEYRTRLSRESRRYYEAKADDDTDKATEVFRDLFDVFRAIGSGGGRVVAPLPDRHVTGGQYDEYVVKLATPHGISEYGGRPQNDREAHVWESSDRDTRQHLMPVVDADPDGYWLIMPRGTEVTADDNEYWLWKQEAEYALRSDVWTEDINRGNSVTLHGEYRLCDYGVNKD